MASGNLLSNAGLVSQGMDDYTQRQQQINQADQNSQLTGQQIQSGQIGLSELQRQNTASSNLRSAVSNSDPTSGRYGAIMSYAKQAMANGDVDAAGKAQEAADSLVMQGRQKLAQAAMYGLDTKTALDQQKELFGENNVGNVEFGTDPNTGDHYAKLIKPDGTSNFFNATQFINSQQKPENLGPGHALYRGSQKIAENTPADQWEIKDGVLYNKTKGPEGAVHVGKDWEIKTVTNGNMEVPVLFNARTNETRQLGPGGVRTGLESHVTQSPTGGPAIVSTPGGGISEYRPAQGATPGKSNLFSPDVPGTPAQAAALVPVQSETTPMQGAQKAPDGNWYVKQGNGWARVDSKQGQQPQTVPNPTQQQPAQPQAAQQPVAPVPQKPQPNPERQAAAADNAKQIQSFNNAMGSGNKREQIQAQKKQDLSDQFQDRVSRLNKQDQMWLEQHTDQMNNAQLKAYRDAKDKALVNQYTKYQSSGLK